MSNLRKTIAAGCFTVTAEIVPPLSASPATLLAKADPLRGLVDAVNVTDAAGARVTMSSTAAASLLLNYGVEPVLQMTCRTRNRLAIEGDLIGNAALGINNVLVLTGDDPTTGDEPESAIVNDLNSQGVVAIAKQMRDEGKIPSGRDIDPAPDLFLGVADSPVDPDADWKPHSLIAKADAGANFVQTQFCFDVAPLKRYMDALAGFGLTDRMAFLIGVGPIASVRSAIWMNENLFGVTVPDSIIKRLEGAADQKAEGRRICVEIIQQLQEVSGVAGVHIMAPNQDMDGIAAVISESGVRAGR
ncbi:MAG: methylenetetrahydrofolate reductase [Alphaproteobacteria bacterium]